VLRFNSEPINGWIPADNPYVKKGGKAVWTLGHRNPQGLCEAELNGRHFIFSSEHGPLSNDEINIIRKGKNYGHPLIIGFADGNYNGLAAGVSDNDDLPGFWNSSYPFIKSEQENAHKMGDSYQDPLITFYPTPQEKLQSLFKQIKQGSDPEWHSEAPSSIAFYGFSAIPAWKNSLLVPALKDGKVIRIPLDDSGTKIAGKAYSYFEDQLRYRDIKISADGLKLYLITDRSKATSGPSKTNKQDKETGGSLIEFEYLP
jgi:glucose/arabinose dehydrogenase